MDLHLSAQGIAVVIALIANALVIAFSAGKIVSKLDNIDKSITRLDAELAKRDEVIESHKEETKKEFKTMWGRIDQVRDMIKA